MLLKPYKFFSSFFDITIKLSPFELQKPSGNLDISYPKFPVADEIFTNLDNSITNKTNTSSRITFEPLLL